MTCHYHVFYLVFFLVSARACPPSYYLAGPVCRPCPPCPAPLAQLVPCGPSSFVGVCGAGLTVTVLVNGTDPRNITYDGTAWPTASSDAVYATCPPDHYHSDADDLCHACRNCTPPLVVELVPCSFASDRVCLPPLVVSAVASGVDFLSDPAALANFSTHPASAEDIAIDVELIPCTSAQFRSPETQLCTPCTPCAPGQAELRPCLPSSDRICNNSLSVELVILGAAGVDLSLLNLTQLLGGLDFPLAQQQDIGLTVVPLPCPSGSYLDAPHLLCLACSQCDLNTYMATACGPDHDTICHNCTACGYGAIATTPCGRTHDAVCVGAVDVEFYIANGTRFNASLLAEGAVSALFVGYDLYVQRIECAEGQFLDRGACSPCSACPSGTAYEASPCTNTTDTVCQTCTICPDNTYEVCPCGTVAFSPRCPTPDRLCNAYAAFNLTLNLSVASLYGYDALAASGYLPTFLASVRAQAAAVSASLSYLGARPYGSNASLYPLASYAPETPLLLALALRVDGVYAQTSRDYSVILERALYAADAALVPGAPGYIGPSRRALADCPADSYAALYPLLPLSQCVPCQDDPVLTAVPSTPPALLYAVAAAACPPDYARLCYGGTLPPVCVLRLAGALLVGNATAQLTLLDCPPQQQQIYDPATGAPLCQAPPCSPGSTGMPGACAACPAGTYKFYSGADPCIPCPAGAFQPAPGAADCAPCPNGATSPAGAAACECSPGHHGNGSLCAECAPGAYASAPAATACLACAACLFQPLPNATACDACAPSEYGPYYGLSVCLACAPGSYSFGGASSCTYCPDGQGVRGLGCAPCALGRAGAGGLCPPCPPDAYAASAGLSACARCTGSTYAPAPGASACLLCPPGAAGTGCPNCSQGAYSTGSGLAACAACPAGMYTPQPGATSPSACQNCGEGTFAGPQECLPCPAFTVAPAGATGERECLARAGYFGLPGRRAQPCPAGSFCVQGSNVPSPCPPGLSSRAASQACALAAPEPVASALRGLDWLVAASWFALAFLGVACVLRTGGRRRLRLML